MTIHSDCTLLSYCVLVCGDGWVYVGSITTSTFIVSAKYTDDVLSDAEDKMEASIKI